MDAKKLFTPPFQYSSNTSEYLLTSDTWSQMAVLHKDSCSISKSPKNLTGKTTSCFGFLGLIHLQHASYLLSISEAKYIGTLHACNIFQISDIEYLPLSSTKDQDSLLSLKSFTANNFLYFSYTYDLTNSIPRILQFRDSYSLDTVDQRFCWNYKQQEIFQKSQAFELILPVISGFVQIEQVSVEGQTVDFGVISRKDHRRAGTRFHTRGVNEEGNAANFVETEQIVAWNDSGKYIINSFVQVRGSIPLIWTQSPNLSWMPKVKIFPGSEPIKRHDSELRKIYKSLVYVNLIDKKGSQKRLGDAFGSALSGIGADSYVWFDFHAECKNMKYENLAKLIETVSERIEGFGWTEVEIETNKEINEGKVRKTQSGVLRTNCVDCLDRTNVVQSVFARSVLHKQLLAIGKKVSDPMGSLNGVLESCFRNFWTNNADVISLMYSGTPAQKTDYTRTGKRTTKGAMLDSKYGLTRYFINNFYDGSRKNANDIFLGNLKRLPNGANDNIIKILTFFALVFTLLISCNVVAHKLCPGIFQPLLFLLLLFLVYKILPFIGSRIVEKPALA